MLEQPHDDLRGDGQGALGADHDAPEVVARRLPRPPAEPRHRAVSQHDLHAEDVVRGDAVGQAVRPAGVLGNVAAYCARPLAGRVRGEVEPVLRRCRGDVQVDHPRLHDRQPVCRVDLQDALHPRERDNEPALLGDGAPAEPGAGAARHDGHPSAGGGSYDRRDLLRAGRQHDRGGHGLVHRAIVLEDDQVLRQVDHVVVADYCSKLVYQQIVFGHMRLPRHILLNRRTGFNQAGNSPRCRALAGGLYFASIDRG